MRSDATQNPCLPTKATTASTPYLSNTLQRGDGVTAQIAIFETFFLLLKKLAPVNQELGDKALREPSTLAFRQSPLLTHRTQSM